MYKHPKIAIVGGSLTGPTLALLLLRAGFDDLTLYDAAPALATRTGGVMSLENTALDVLATIGIPQREIVTGRSDTIAQITVRNRRPIKTTRIPYPGRFTTWALLHAALRARLPGSVLHLGTRIVGLHESVRGPVVVRADGSSEPADLVVFADGRNSIGRRLLDPGRQTCYSGCVAHRGTSSRPGDPSGDFRRYDLGQGGQFNLAPVPGGQDWIFGLNASPNEFRAWFGVSPGERSYVTDGQIGGSARSRLDQEAVDRLPAAEAHLVVSTRRRAAVAIMDVDPPTSMVWPIGAGYAVLLGDALAPPRPVTARGANAGIEQAAGLVQCLRHGQLGDDLRDWERHCLPDAVATLERGLLISSRLGLGTSHTIPVLDGARR
ncbi:FAD-dependent monooxygenase [Cryptosporangium arvum]|uniref:2-polyprenyl-6-methoxyphenol hydroxylase-like oxidoreductase n=1 Tax=Cryptosporangium arvum DSM 44712 TaxID=927661 RepID=A0A010YP69_9ACTN|nr:FAD-dependent monooxygenase [Cryptosporangium arvum]EXG81985.1 2-polyprenyl-6-methoxyphenol hydroxylase-like oxidoreductase [Cryptosporangium arvum DSM 44712]